MFSVFCICLQFTDDQVDRDNLKLNQYHEGKTAQTQQQNNPKEL